MMKTDTGYEKRYYFGIDIGGTSVKAAVFDESDNTVGTYEFATDKEDNGSHILNDVADFVSSWMNENGADASVIGGIGIGVPGAVLDDGTVNGCVNLGWGVVNVKAELERLTGIRTVAGNDANVAALGEAWKGAAAGSSDVIMVTLGTGVGGGIIVDGKIVTGHHGAGGEIGHANVDHHETESCNCGNRGCLEQYASATGITRLANMRLAKDEKPSTLRNVAEMSAKEVFDAVKAGDEVAIEIATEFGKYLGHALANLAAACDKAVIVIGGGVSKAGEVLLDYIKGPFKEMAFFADKDTEFALAELANDAGICGAAKLVLK